MKVRLSILAGLVVTVLSGTGPLGALRAGQTVEVPSGCTPLVTVHRETCVTTIVFDCEGDRLVRDYDPRGLAQQALYDPEWLLEDYTYFNEGVPVMTMRKLSGSDRMMTPLLETGVAEVSGKVVMSTGVIRDREYSFKGTATLTGETRTIGDTEFLLARITNDLTFREDVPGMSFAFEVLIDPARNLQIEGAWQRDAFGGGTEDFPHHVRAVLNPGEQGFLTVAEEGACG